MSSEEILDVIDSENRVIGQASKKDVHKDNLPHRVVHVFVVSEQTVFLVKRAMTVTYCPGYYCSSAGGHVQTGESTYAAALRELEEEIGLSGHLEHLDDFFPPSEPQIRISLFVKGYDILEDRIALNLKEVLSGAFYSWDQIAALDRSLFHPQLPICLEKLYTVFGKV